MTKKELKNWIYSRLGYPMVRVELHESQIESAINSAKDQFIKWGSGESTQEIFFTIALSAGINEYDLPSGITTITKVNEFNASMTGINTLFTVQNYLYNTGVLSFLKNIGSYSMVDYHLSLQFIEVLDKYMPNYYNWRYDKYNNKLIISPTPTIDVEVGYLIIHSYMLMGTDENTTELTDDVYNMMWNNPWVQNYSLAIAKETLGLIRRKFANGFNSIGNAGINLDGDSLISEGKEDKERLMEEIKNSEYSSEGYGILIG